MRRVESHDGKVCFVHLCCDHNELLQWVSTSSRKRRGNLTTKSGLDRMFKRFNFFAEVPTADGFSIDTTRRAPKQAARDIAQHYKLPTVPRRR